MVRSRSTALLAIGLVVFHYSTAEGARFAGNGHESGLITVTGFSSLGLDPTSWTFDFETDGQAIYFHQYDLTYSGRVQIPNHAQVYIDLTIEASFSAKTLDLNPVPGSELWQTEPYRIHNVRIAGTYHSLAYANSFDKVVQPDSFSSFDTKLDFSGYPNSLLIGDFGQFGQDTLSFSNLGIELEPRFSITNLELFIDRSHAANAAQSAPCPCCGCADYNKNGEVDAADYVLWRKSLGSVVDLFSSADGDGSGTVDDSDYRVWRSYFGNSRLESATLLTVPEPATWLACPLAIALAGWRHSVSRVLLLAISSMLVCGTLSQASYAQVNLLPVIQPVDLEGRPGQLVKFPLMASGTLPITWSEVQQISGSRPVIVAPTLSSIGLFEWHSLGVMPYESYSFSATATNQFGRTTGLAVQVRFIPEPPTLALGCLATVSFIGLAGRRKQRAAFGTAQGELSRSLSSRSCRPTPLQLR